MGMNLSRREGLFRLAVGLLAGLLAVLAGTPLLTDGYGVLEFCWQVPSVAGWGALLGLTLSRLLYRGNWRSWRPGPPGGYPVYRVGRGLRAALLGLGLFYLAMSLVTSPDQSRFGLLGASLSFLVWFGYQSWDVSTASGVLRCMTFYGLQWLPPQGRSWPSSRQSRPQGPRSDEAPYQARCDGSRRVGQLLYLFAFMVPLAGVSGRDWPLELIYCFYAGIPFYLLGYRLAYWTWPSGVATRLKSVPQPRSWQNPLILEPRATHRRGWLVLLLLFPASWVVLAPALLLLMVPSVGAAHLADLNERWFCVPWLLWLLLKVLEYVPSSVCYEVDLSDLSVYRHEVKHGYQFSQPVWPGAQLVALGVTPTGQWGGFSSVLYFSDGEYLTLSDHGELSWARERACRLADRTLLPVLSPKITTNPHEVAIWIRQRKQQRLTDWPELPSAPPEVGDSPPVH